MRYIHAWYKSDSRAKLPVSKIRLDITPDVLCGSKERSGRSKAKFSTLEIRKDDENVQADVFLFVISASE